MLILTFGQNLKYLRFLFWNYNKIRKFAFGSVKLLQSSTKNIFSGRTSFVIGTLVKRKIPNSFNQNNKNIKNYGIIGIFLQHLQIFLFC